jgi:VWFA-related protein
MPRVLRVLLFSLLSTCCFAGNIVYLRVHRGVVEERLNTPPGTGLERLHKLRAQFEAAGCTREHLSEQAIPRQDLPNVMCNLPGKEPGTIVVGAPIDFDAVGTADESQWATLALLPLLAESVGAVQHRLSLTFVAFTGHNHGLRGSSEYVKQLTESQRRGIRAMISLEDMGRTPPVYALAQEDLLLVNWLALSSNTLRLGSIPMEITARSVDAPLINNRPVFNQDEYLLDASAFQHAHVPAIALRSAPLSMIPAMRQAGAWQGYSSGKFFDLDIYEQTYNQLCVYLLYLDSNLGTSHSSPPGTEVAAAPVKPSPTTAGVAIGQAPVLNPNTLASATIPPSTSTTQQPTGIPPITPVFHAQAQLVLMDVSIIDERGAPVKGLKAEDFTVLENGKPQVVRAFEEHGPQSDSAASQENSLAPGTFSNRMAAATDAPLSIFLFDLLNTPPQDQAYARAQMLQFLKAMPRGKHLALFVLGRQLQMVQGFTDDSEGLVKMAEKVMRDVSPLLTTQAQQQQDQGFVDQTGREARPETSPSIPPQFQPAVTSAITDAKPLIGFEGARTDTGATMEGVRSEQRITLTLEALQVIARAVSAYPGRKNLAWLSGSFQVRLRPSDNSFLNMESRTTQAITPVSDLTNSTRYEDAIRVATTALATARIAVYPIDVRGLRTSGVDISVGTDQSRAMVDSGNNDSITHTLMNQSQSRSDDRSSMLEIAEQTGGRVFINNDVRGSIARSLEEGSNYYTLAYTPEKSDSQSFRRVEIKLDRPSAKLAYRPGYYPSHSQEALKQSGAHMLAAAMQPGLPQSTMLVVTAKLLPPDATSKALRIDYNIDLSGLDFTDTTDNRKRALLDCMAVAIDGHGQIAGQIANTMDAALPPQEYQLMQQTGLPLHQELVLPPGTYDLRLGVLDRASQKIGTVDIPVVIPAESAPAATGTGVGIAKASAAEPTSTTVPSTATVASNASPSSAPVPPGAQQPTGIPPNVPVFHAQAQLVVMDVSITDAQGAPVKGLKAGDFTLLENGKPQVVRVFEAHVSSAASGASSPQNSLPAGTFSNRVTPTSADAPLSIFLFDLLNTPPNDQAYARAQMLQFLKTVPKGKHLALFVLGTHLQIVQGFTDDSETLVKTAEKVMRQASPLLTTQVQLQQDQGFIEETARDAQPHVPDQAGLSIMAINAAMASPSAPGFAAQRTATSATQECIRTDQRTTMTLEAMEAIARAVSAYPGRKNMVWLSGSFEIRLRPFDNTFVSIASVSSQAAVPVSNLATNFSYENEIRRVTTVMATARIAIYPIDVRGLQTGGVEIGVGADQSRDMVNSPIGDAYTDVLSSQSGTRFNQRASMLELADQTGGHLYIENDVRGSIARSLEEGSNYYTLAYTPEKNSDDSFRRVEIKLNRPSVKLAYRPGYYPTRSQDSLTQSGAQMLAAAMQPGLPQSTMILVTAKVLPPDATSKAVRIDYSIDLSGLDFTDMSDNRKRALLDCMAVALDAHGQITGQIANTMDASLPPKDYQAFQQTGLPLHQELVLPPGTYDLRLGVLDRASQKIGTVDVPVVIAAKLP